MPQTTLSASALQEHLARIEAPNRAFAALYPGSGGERQPVHSVYGGAHLFRADTAPRMGQAALRVLDAHGADFASFSAALGLDPDGEAGLCHTVYERMRAKLAAEPVEDFRIDFEDGFGLRPDAEEDAAAVSAATEVVRGARAGTLPPFLGIRIKPLTEELKARSARTLDLFISTLVREGGGIPPGFVITLPKVTVVEQVEVFVGLLERLEAALGLAAGALRLEFMVELPQAVLGQRGEAMPLAFYRAAGGRCRGVHFGTYDYTAGSGIAAAWQKMGHPVCDFAKLVLQVALVGTGTWLSDGATNVMPVEPHKGPDLGPAEVRANQRTVHQAWKQHFDDVTHSLRMGYYQGWDLHPAQLPTRYAAVYHFFLREREASTARLRNFVEQATRATLVGAVFDDAATGQGLLNAFLRGLSCGAYTEEEVLATGITLEELRGRSFMRILENRKARG